MDNTEAYNQWAHNYDMVVNKTRDIEAEALRSILVNIGFDAVLEIGCGTGKNTEWLLMNAGHVTAADFSEEMLAKAKDKINSDKVNFIQTDVRNRWPFEDSSFNLVTFSLMLEHIENIDFIFSEARRVLQPGGFIYIGELHPFKQYAGSKARFDTKSGVFELECFIHNISDFFNIARKYDFECIKLLEWFDDTQEPVIPRLLTMFFKGSLKY